MIAFTEMLNEIRSASSNKDIPKILALYVGTVVQQAGVALKNVPLLIEIPAGLIWGGICGAIGLGLNALEGVRNSGSRLASIMYHWAKESIEKMCEAIKYGAKHIWENIKAGSKDLGNILKKVWGKILKAVGSVVEAIGKNVDKLKKSELESDLDGQQVEPKVLKGIIARIGANLKSEGASIDRSSGHIGNHTAALKNRRANAKRYQDKRIL